MKHLIFSFIVLTSTATGSVVVNVDSIRSVEVNWYGKTVVNYKNSTYHLEVNEDIAEVFQRIKEAD